MVGRAMDVSKGWEEMEVLLISSGKRKLLVTGMREHGEAARST